MLPPAWVAWSSADRPMHRTEPGSLWRSSRCTHAVDRRTPWCRSHDSGGRSARLPRVLPAGFPQTWASRLSARVHRCWSGAAFRSPVLWLAVSEWDTPRSWPDGPTERLNREEYRHARRSEYAWSCESSAARRGDRPTTVFASGRRHKADAAGCWRNPLRTGAAPRIHVACRLLPFASAGLPAINFRKMSSKPAVFELVCHRRQISYFVAILCLPGQLRQRSRQLLGSCGSPRIRSLGVGGERDPVPGMWINSRQGATGTHGAGLAPVSLPMWQAVQRAQHGLGEPDAISKWRLRSGGVLRRRYKLSLRDLAEMFLIRRLCVQWRGRTRLGGTGRWTSPPARGQGGFQFCERLE